MCLTDWYYMVYNGRRKSPVVFLGDQNEMNKRIYNFPVWGTQGGGLVREVGNHFVFVEKPDCPGLDVGDFMPAEWDYQPANRMAREQLKIEQFGALRDDV